MELIDRYKNEPFSKQGEELLIANIQQFVRVKALGGALFKYLVGEISLEDILSKFNKRVPLREELVSKILKAFKIEYDTLGNYREASARGDKGSEERTSGDIYGLWNKSGLSRRGSVLDDTHYSLPSILFFDAEGNVIDMDTISEATALEMVDGRVRDMMAYDYDKSVVAIAKDAKDARRATRAYYAEERRKRRGKNHAPRTNAAKIDELFADTDINSLPLEVQALIFIAEGRTAIAVEPIP